MSEQPVVRYEVADRVARITLNRPERGNGITPALVAELSECVRRADLDPAVHVMLLAGAGPGFCGGYDLVESAEGMGVEGASERHDGHPDGAEQAAAGARERAPAGSPLDPAVMAANHDPRGTWDPMVDYAMMSRNVQGFMSLFHCGKPVVCKVHGFCVAGGTDMALCSDLLVIAEDAKIGYPPARVWGSPTTALWAHRIGAQRAKRLLFTGDSLSGREAVEWGLAIEAPPADRLDERTEILVGRIARMPVNQLMMMKLLVNQTLYAQGLHASQVLGTVFDGITPSRPRATPSSATPPSTASARRCASATSRSATPGARPSKARTRGLRWGRGTDSRQRTAQQGAAARLSLAPLPRALLGRRRGRGDRARQPDVLRAPPLGACALSARARMSSAWVAPTSTARWRSTISTPRSSWSTSGSRRPSAAPTACASAWRSPPRPRPAGSRAFRASS